MRTRSFILNTRSFMRTHTKDRNERKRQGYTQAETAGLCGVGTTFLSDLENGKPTAELGKALFVARSLGIDLFAVKRGA